MKLKREIQITPAFDERSDDPKKDYGIGACALWFVVSGSKGAITLRFGTNWYLKSTIAEYKKGIYRNRLDGGKEQFKTSIDLEKTSDTLNAWSIDYHSKKKVKYAYRHENCEFIGGKTCWCDGSCLDAEQFGEILVEQGSDAVFELLEEKYKTEFGVSK